MIVITGATGRLGRGIVEALLSRVSGETLGVSVRDPAKAADLAARGVRVRRGDFSEPDSLAHAFEGATQLLLVSSNAGAQGGDPLVQHQAAIKAACDVGVQRIVYTSHMGVSDTSAFAPMRDHHATEDMLRESGVAWTALRNGFYASSGVMLLGDAATSGRLAAPSDGKVSWTAHADLAEAAAILLTEPKVRFEGPTPPLTASQAVDLADLADILSEVCAHRIHREVISDAAFRDRLIDRGTPDRAADIFLSIFVASRAGEFATVDPTLENLLGRPPLGMRDAIADAFCK